MSTITLLHTNGSKARHLSQSWMQISVQKFFTAINWEDNPPEIQQVRLAASEPNNISTLSMTMNVSQFFAALNWDGNEIAAVTQDQPSIQPPKPDEITLDDFSNLF
ncbi:hypothetical protein [Leptothermofonsia sp. ETS-13]|uniref:hypothetical protein n=1 Tax=Leptothermofonsia sp. ETS-13 TaxID=3035696 RepID=UPI003BA16B08